MFKPYLGLILLLPLVANATDGNDRFQIKIESTQDRIYRASTVVKIENHLNQYMPPVINDFVAYGVNAVVTGLLDNSINTLG